MKRPHRPAPELFHLPPYPDVHRVLTILLQAFKEAQDTGQPPWEYAEELPCFRDAGVPTCTLRWLIDKGIIGHGYEQIGGRSVRRRFRRVKSHVFKENSCFILMAETVGKVREALLETIIDPTKSVTPGRHEENYVPYELPVWNSATGELWYENDLVLKLSPRALNRRKLLGTCQDNDWQQPIQSPFRIDENKYMPDTLHNTLEPLNREQINRRLYFYRDGTGKSFRWKPLSRS